MLRMAASASREVSEALCFGDLCKSHEGTL